MNCIADQERAAARQQLLTNIAGVRDVLAAQCDIEEAQATLSNVSVQALSASGVLLMKTPRALGGGECDPVTQLEAIEALAAINGSAAWCTMVGATSLAMPGAFLPDSGIARMFGADARPRGAIVVTPSGEALPVDGGYRVKGRWSFASGVRHADWLVALARVPRDQSSAPEIHFVVIPCDAVRIEDNWQVTGLKGTGSCDVVVDDVFVPADMGWNVHTTAPRRGGPLYRIALPAFVANEHAGFALGTARRALDGLVDIARAKKRGYTPAALTLADRGTVQRFIGQAEMRLRAARALAIEANEDVWATISSGRPVSQQQQAENRSAAVYATEVAAEVVTGAFRFAGGSVIYQTHFLQRCLRDIQVAAQHFMVNDTAYEILGRARLGIAEADAMN